MACLMLGSACLGPLSKMLPAESYMRVLYAVSAFTMALPASGLANGYVTFANFLVCQPVVAGQLFVTSCNSQQSLVTGQSSHWYPVTGRR